MMAPEEIPIHGLRTKPRSPGRPDRPRLPHEYRPPEPHEIAQAMHRSSRVTRDYWLTVLAILIGVGLVWLGLSWFGGELLGVFFGRG